MNNEDSLKNNDHEHEESQSTTADSSPLGEDQANQPMPPASEDIPIPEDKKRKTSGARKLRDLVAESLNLPGWSLVREFLNNLEDRLEDQDDEEGGKPKV